MSEKPPDVDERMFEVELNRHEARAVSLLGEILPDVPEEKLAEIVRSITLGSRGAISSIGVLGAGRNKGGR